MVLLLCACNKGSAGAPYLLTTNNGHVEVKTAGAYHLNDDYPVSFTSDAGRTAVELTKTACADDAAHHCIGAAPVPSGGGTLAFSVCSAEQCLIEKVPIP